MAISVNLIIFSFALTVVKAEVCPKECDCDMQNGLKRAICENQQIISIDIGVPSYVQVYDLHSNAISELDNFCFANVGYTSLKILNLSYNRIFWMGLHAFSGLGQLFHLDLSNNRLRSVTPDLFWDTPLLEYLDLSGNVFESLKNEPFLMHTALKVLNLSNCRINALPPRTLNRLPNLRKLDLSDNYMISLQITVLVPLKRLERLELRNEYWKCVPEFIATENWIISRGIVYNKQCLKKSPKMSEKMISLGSPEVRKDVDIRKVWNVTDRATTVPTNAVEPKKPLTMYERFERDFPSLWALLVGFEVGLVLGVAGTYFWLRSLCKCSALKCRRPETPRQRRRLQRLNDNELRVNLLWSAAVQSNIDTPPSYRRQLELPDGPAVGVVRGEDSTSNAGRRGGSAGVVRGGGSAGVVRGGPSAGDAVRGGGEGVGGEVRGGTRAETPPPPYAECGAHGLCNS